MKSREEAVAEIVDRLSQGASIEESIRELRDVGCSKIQSIKALTQSGRATLRSAKPLVHYSETWSDVRDADDAFHDALEAALEEDE